MEAAGERPSAPILDVDESKDLKVFYHNVAYKTNRVVINLEKMKVWNDGLVYNIDGSDSLHTAVAHEFVYLPLSRS
eukprot:gene7394-7603_t